MLTSRLLVVVLLLIAPTVAASPPLVGSVQLGGPPTGGRASSDAKVFVAFLQATGQRPLGLQVIDTSDAQHPRLAGFLPLPKHGTFELSRDGKFALVVVRTEATRFNVETGHEVIAIDLADAQAPRELWRQKIAARKVELAPDATVFGYSRRIATNRDRWETIVTSVSDREGRIAIEEKQYSDANMAFSPNGRFLAYMSSGTLQVVDLHTSPPAAFKQDSAGGSRYRCISAVLDDGHVVVQDFRAYRLGIYRAAPRVPRIALMPLEEGTKHCKDQNLAQLESAFMYSEREGRIQRIDLFDSDHPKWEGYWRLPPGRYPEAAQKGIVFAYVGDGNRAFELELYRLRNDPSDKLDWAAMGTAHEEITRAYKAGMKDNRSKASWAAVERFEDSGIIHFLDAPVSNISERRAAAILNDFGFLASEWAPYWVPNWVVESALNRAIALDPTRALAHLNLADFVRTRGTQKSDAGAVRTNWRKDAEKHYRAYLNLGGKRSPSIESFLNDKLLVHDGVEVCDAIEAHARAGRLKELISGSGSAVTFNGKRIDVYFVTDGSAHIPTYYTYESDTDFPVSDKDSPALPWDDLWTGDELGVVAFGGQQYVLWYKDFNTPMAAKSLVGDDYCQFDFPTGERGSNRELQ